MADRTLRIQAIQIQVLLVWDDGQELRPGPPLEPMVVTLSQAIAMLDRLPSEIANLAVQIKASEPAE